MVSSVPAGEILRPSGRMTLPSPLRCAGTTASADAGWAVQLDLNEGPASPQPQAVPTSAVTRSSRCRMANKYRKILELYSNNRANTCGSVSYITQLFPTYTDNLSVVIGYSVGNYVVQRQIGEGGMGAVYLAEHPRIGRKVAIKVLLRELSANAQAVSRFFNEARASSGDPQRAHRRRARLRRAAPTARLPRHGVPRRAQRSREAAAQAARSAIRAHAAHHQWRRPRARRGARARHRPSRSQARQRVADAARATTPTSSRCSTSASPSWRRRSSSRG